MKPTRTSLLCVAFADDSPYNSATHGLVLTMRFYDIAILLN